MNFSETASKRYFIFPIKKHNGQIRMIAHPAKPLKSLQRWLNSRLFRTFDVHNAATAYRRGSNIRANALRHVATNFTLRVDFKDFFPSFKSDGIERYLRDRNKIFTSLNEEDINFVVNIVTRSGELTIGSPSSPILTNVMMYDFDKCLADFCEKRGLIYSRYADDLFISSFQSHMLGEVYDYIKDLSSKFPYAKLLINEEKTVFLSRRYKRQITGLVITADRKISIGRDRKREIKSLVYDFKNGVDLGDKLQYLKGLIAFCNDVDALFLEALRKKYGNKTISKLIG